MGLIKNYGLLWDRDHVEWGTRGQGNHGTLMGYQRGKKKRVVDFRGQAGVYILYEGSIAQQRVTYVGQAGSGGHDLYSRLKQHRTDHLRNRWERFSWFGLYNVGASDTLIHTNANKNTSAGNIESAMNHLEGVLMSSLEPLLNKQGARWAGGVEEYLQYSDAWGTGEALLSIMSMLEDLGDAVARLEDELEEIREEN